MDSDEYFDDDFDSSFLHEVAAIEAAHVAASAGATHSPEPQPSGSKPRFKPAAMLKPQSKPTGTANILSSSSSFSSRRPAIPEGDDSSDHYFDDPITLNDADYATLDAVAEGKNIPRNGCVPAQLPESSGPSTFSDRHSNLIQRNLFGEVVRGVEPPKTGSNTRPFQRTRSSLRQMPLPGQAKRTKQWDRTAYAKTGWRKPKPNQEKEKEKGKGRASDNDDDEESIEFEQFPAPEIPVG